MATLRKSQLPPLKYSLNPHQKYARVSREDGLPFEVWNGKPGQINLLDALHAWPLVKELKLALNFSEAAAVYKHLSAAGAAVTTPMTEEFGLLCGYKEDWNSNLANAVLRAMYGDPKSGFGGIMACSHEVDYETALAMKPLVLDGVIAPDYTEEALGVLEKKKWDKDKQVGNFVVLRMEENYEPPERESRELYGIRFDYDRNNLRIDRDLIRKGECGDEVPDEAIDTLVVAGLATKYSQSNNITMAYDGQVTGLAAGQQSRVDAVRLAGEKTNMWFSMQHPLVYDAYTHLGPMSRITKQQQLISQLPDKAISEWLEQHEEICLWSDAFFPFPDGPDTASEYGVAYLVAPAGSIRDEEVREAAEENDQILVHLDRKDRLFTH